MSLYENLRLYFLYIHVGSNCFRGDVSSIYHHKEKFWLHR